MGTHYIPRNVKGEGRILMIFTTKSLITTAIFGAVGLLFFYLFKSLGATIVGIILGVAMALIGYGVGMLKIPYIPTMKFTKNIAGDSIDDIVMRYLKFKMNKKVYVYTEIQPEVQTDAKVNTKEEK